MSVFTKFKNIFKKQPVNVLHQQRPTETSIRRLPSNSSLASIAIAENALDYFRDEIQHVEVVNDQVEHLAVNILKSEVVIDSKHETSLILVKKEETTHEIPEPLNNDSEPLELSVQNAVNSEVKCSETPQKTQSQNIQIKNDSKSIKQRKQPVVYSPKQPKQLDIPPPKQPNKGAFHSPKQPKQSEVHFIKSTTFKSRNVKQNKNQSNLIKVTPQKASFVNKSKRHELSKQNNLFSNIKTDSLAHQRKEPSENIQLPTNNNTKPLVLPEQPAQPPVASADEQPAFESPNVKELREQSKIVKVTLDQKILNNKPVKFFEQNDVSLTLVTDSNITHHNESSTNLPVPKNNNFKPLVLSKQPTHPAVVPIAGQFSPGSPKVKKLEKQSNRIKATPAKSLLNNNKLKPIKLTEQNNVISNAKSDSIMKTKLSDNLAASSNKNSKPLESTKQTVQSADVHHSIVHSTAIENLAIKEPEDQPNPIIDKPEKALLNNKSKPVNNDNYSNIGSNSHQHKEVSPKLSFLANNKSMTLELPKLSETVKSTPIEPSVGKEQSKAINVAAKKALSNNKPESRDLLDKSGVYSNAKPASDINKKSSATVPTSTNNDTKPLELSEQLPQPVHSTVAPTPDKNLKQPQSNNIKVTPEKALPEVYLQLLTILRYNNQKSITESVLKYPPFYEKILSKCIRWTFNAKDAAEKFEVYNYLQLVQDFLEADSPLAKNATISFEDDESKELRRLLNESQQHLPSIQKGSNSNAKKNIMIIKVPYQKEANIEDKIIPMLQIILHNENKEVDKDSKMLKIRIAVVIPSRNNEPTILIAVLNTQELKEFENLSGEETFSIFVTPNIDASNAVMFGIQKVLQNRMLSEKVFFRPEQNEMAVYCKKMTKEIGFMPLDPSKPFNQKQKEAIYAMTRPSISTTFVLYGPPGSGKSYTIVEAIRHLLLPQPSKYFQPSPSNRKILICTPSNMAADAIAEAIVDRNFIDLKEVFRLMSSSRDAFSRNHKLDSITRTTVLLDTNNDAIRPVYDVPTSNVLKSYKIITCTLGSTPKMSRYLPPGHFSHIFVDEAAQASETEIWLALGHLATAETRLILAGDPMQLGPGTNVGVLNKDCYGFKTSLLLRLTGQTDVSTNPQYLIQLTDNHRSHHQIVKLSSMLFYFNTVIPKPSDESNSLCQLSFLRRGDFPILFHHVSWGFEEISDTRSRRNLAEADVVFRYVLECLQQRVEEKDIGVIAPYKFQGEAIRARLRQYPAITVETVERFQGSERRVIIISTVRTNDTMGFMGEFSRINTAITRAKHLLIIVGNSSCLMNHFQWKGIIDFCAENRSFVNCFPY